MKSLFKTNKPLAIKKCAALFLILVGALFVLINKGVYYSTHTESVSTKNDIPEYENTIKFEGDKTFEQEFSGWNGTLQSITLRFDNQGNAAATGSVTIHICDQNGSVLQSTTKPLNEVKMSTRTTFAFEETAELSEDETYLLQVMIEDAHNPQGFGIYTYEEKGDLFGTLSEDGTSISGRLRATFQYQYYNTDAMLHMLMLLALALLFVLIPFQKIDAWISTKWNRNFHTNVLLLRLFFIGTPALCVMMGDRINDYHLSEIIHRIFSWTFIFNALIYLVILLVVYLIVNRTQYTCMIVISFAFIANLANYYVWQFRGCPILATDLQSAKTALNVAANFSYQLDMTGVWGVVYLTAFLAMILSLNGCPGLSLKKRAGVLLLTAASIGMFNVVFLQSDIIRNHHITHNVWKPQARYAQNGTALSFVLSWSYSRVEKPEGYSVEKANTIMEQYESDSAVSMEKATTESPNIIAIMNEALADLSYNSNIHFSEDYLPYLHSLEENTIKGKLYVSIEGSNTANSEFEFLTGNTMTFLPYRCIPYNLYIKNTTPSMAQNMQALGYGGINSYHPFLGSGWNRTNVYPLLGFNNFYDREYYIEQGNDQLVRNYISDEADFNQIIADYETARNKSDAPFYLFNVTMQNHGAYDGLRGYIDAEITISDDELASEEAEQYINLARKSDAAFQMLTEYFQTVDEPTLIVMFGDHQPPLSNSFYSAQFGCSINNISTEQRANWYATPYVIWANYDIDEAELDMSDNYLSSYVLKTAGLPLTGFNKYLLELQEKLPVISAVCYKDSDGNFYDNDEVSEYTELLSEYQMIQYNELFGKENRNDGFFFLKD